MHDSSVKLEISSLDNFCHSNTFREHIEWNRITITQAVSRQTVKASYRKMEGEDCLVLRTYSSRKQILLGKTRQVSPLFPLNNAYSLDKVFTSTRTTSWIYIPVTATAVFTFSRIHFTWTTVFLDVNMSRTHLRRM